MKSIYTLLFSLSIFTIANAQTAFKLKNPKHASTSILKHVNQIAKTQNVVADVTCITQYTAGTTMDLVFTYMQTNNDGEYVDSLAITFPAGITPTGLGNTSNPFPNTEDAGGGLETLNSPNGQVISWGRDTSNANEQYGGIYSSAGINFTIQVNVSAGLTGMKTASFFTSGDGYPGIGASSDDSGTFKIFEAGTPVNGYQTKLVGLQLGSLFTVQPTQCALTTQSISTQLYNLGMTDISTLTVKASVNGVPTSTVMFNGLLKPGDSAMVVFPNTYNFSTQGFYTVKAWAKNTGDVDQYNDTATLILVNSMPVNLSTTIYNNSFETAYNFASLNSDFVSGSGSEFGVSQNPHKGLQALLYYVSYSAPPGVNEEMLITPCVNVTAGDIYKISYWKKSNGASPSTNAETAIFTGLSQKASAMTTTIKPYTAIIPNLPAGNWTKDSVNYTASATETRYFAIGGRGNVSATSNIDIRLDDLIIEKIGIASGLTKFGVDVEQIVFYPNPTNSEINVRLNSKKEELAAIIIYDVIGNVVIKQEQKINSGLQTYPINIESLVQGVYFVEIKNSLNELITKQKLVIQK